MLVKIDEEKDIELKRQFLKLIKNDKPLIDFPLLDYSSEDIYNILFELRNNGLITIRFGSNNDIESNVMEMLITDKGNEFLKNGKL